MFTLLFARDPVFLLSSLYNQVITTVVITDLAHKIE